MPHSMTGFASAAAEVPPFQLTWELRSVNHRYLDLSFRLPDELKRLEPRCRDTVTGRIKRGKLDCALKVSLQEQTGNRTDVDPAALDGLASLEREVRATMPQAAPLAVSDILRWPGVLKEPARNYAALEAPVLEALTEAVSAMQAARESEGARIAAFLEQRNATIVESVARVRPMLREIEERYRGKLLERIDRLNTTAQAERIEQELAFIAQRMDVAEEIDRLESHVTEIRAVLRRDEPIGRRLEFLIQELNREANTLGSKAQDEELTRISVDLKVVIEQMREQVQNLE